MILSVSRRTDIPRYYAEWFSRRIDEGFVLVRNPRNPHQVSRVSLSPDLIDGIVLWSKDPAPLFLYLPRLDSLGYHYYFQFTLTPYGSELEPGLRQKEVLIRCFQELSELVGRKRVLWRYDPIIVDAMHTVSWHQHAFSKLCAQLAPYTSCVTVSFVDLYRKLRGSSIRKVTEHEVAILSTFIAETSLRHGIQAKACCEPYQLTSYGIEPAACVDARLFEQLCGGKLHLRRDRNQRTGCGCAESIDIGAYDCCPGGCLYCYANQSTDTVKQQCARHNSNSPLLIGTLSPEDHIYERKVRSQREDQIDLFQR